MSAQHKEMLPDVDTWNVQQKSDGNSVFGHFNITPSASFCKGTIEAQAVHMRSICDPSSVGQLAKNASHAFDAELES